MLVNAVNESYTWKDVALDGKASGVMHACSDTDDLYPFLVVNIGSGVSIIKVTSQTEYERVSGTCLGGGTYLGLCRLLANCQSFDDAMEVANEGDNRKVDMMVGDIYGGGYEQFGLKSTTIASSFGKMVLFLFRI